MRAPALACVLQVAKLHFHLDKRTSNMTTSTEAQQTALA
jgi:hypothetical protein